MVKKDTVDILRIIGAIILIFVWGIAMFELMGTEEFTQIGAIIAWVLGLWWGIDIILPNSKKEEIKK